MKVFLIMLLFVSFLQSDEMRRIESIVEDISKLRAQHEECKNSLNAKETLKAKVLQPGNNTLKISKYKKELKIQKQKNIILLAQRDKLNKSLLNADKMIKKYKKLLKTKEKRIFALNNKYKSSKKTTQKTIKAIEVCAKIIDDNPFPKLMLKENVRTIEKIQITNASTFRLKTDSSIYNLPNGKKINSWTKNTSFTSNKKTNNWVKITGHFIDKKWKKVEKNMWIKSLKVIKR